MKRIYAFLAVVTLAIFILSSPLHAQGYIGYEAPKGDVARFSNDVQKITKDWVAAPWERGRMQIHPLRYKQSAYVSYMRLNASELPANRSAQSVLTHYFDDWKIGEVLDERKVSMAGAIEMAPKLLVKSETWSTTFGTKSSLWGVITTHDNLYIPFEAQCTNERNSYDAETCLRNIFKMALYLQSGAVTMPQTEAPIYVPGWSGSYDHKGTSLLQFHAIRGAGVSSITGSSHVWVASRSSFIHASAPQSLAANAVRSAIIAFADRTKTPDNDTPDPATWQEDAYVRTFPKSIDGPAFQIVTAQKMPDNRYVLLSLNCYNKNWSNTCSQAMSRVIGDIVSGMMTRRLAGLK